MDLLLILTYAALCIAIFKIFNIPLKKGMYLLKQKKRSRLPSRQPLSVYAKARFSAIRNS